MFRCKECHIEYETKPDYCDCGNDEFEEIVSTPIKKEAKNYFGQDFKKDLPSIAFFIICVILSVLSLIFIGRGEQKELSDKNIKTTEIKETKEIPSIDKIWKTAPILQNNNNQKESEKAKIQPLVKESAAKKPSSNMIKKPAQKTASSSIPTQKPVQKTQTVPPLTPKTSSNTNNKGSIKNTPIQPSSAKNTVQDDVIFKTEEKTAPKQNTVINTANKEDFITYKKNLRNKIASNINLAGILGDGTAKVKFKIDSTGRLIEKSFALQSDNDSINDAVYGAIVNFKSYNPPPAFYNGEFLYFMLKMYGGNFEITLN